MDVLTSLSQVTKQYPNPVIAIGIFDGLHRGHQRVINRVIKQAHQCCGTAVVMTFNPHPLHVLKPQKKLPLITSLELREKLLMNMGIQVCWFVRFTQNFAKISPSRFIEQYLIKRMPPHTVIVGDDFRFGRNRDGTLNLFKKAGQKYNFSVQTVTTTRGERKNISSTEIRQHILDGKLKEASRLLGRPFAIQGKVVHGESLGRKLGFPTANIKRQRQVTPAPGVYVVHVQLNNQMYPAMAYVGRRPSIKLNAQLNIEVNIFDFNYDIYGEEITIFFHKKIRDEKKFDSRQALVQNINSDEEKARRWFIPNRFCPQVI